MITAGKDKGGRFIYICDPSYSANFNEETANSRLIVAAPDLLAAAKGILPFIHERKMKGETEYEQAVLALEVAIKKAKRGS